MLVLLTVLAVVALVLVVQVLRDHQALRTKVEGLSGRMQDLESLRSPMLRAAVAECCPQPLRKRYQVGLSLTDGILKLLSDEEMSFWNDQAITLPSLTIERWRSHTVVEARFHEKDVPVVKERTLLGREQARETTLWEAAIGPAVKGYSMLAPRVIVVLDGEWVKFGAEGGRFKWSPLPDFSLLKENTFDMLPLEFRLLRGESEEKAKSAAGDSSEWSVDCEVPGTAVTWYVTAFNLEKYAQ